jgi:hypothetical protein
MLKKTVASIPFRRSECAERMAAFHPEPTPGSGTKRQISSTRYERGARRPPPIGGLEIEKATLGADRRAAPRAESRIKFREIFNSRTAKPSQVLDFESDLLSEGSARTDRGSDEEKPNPLESFPDRSPRHIFFAHLSGGIQGNRGFRPSDPPMQFRDSARGAARRFGRGSSFRLRDRVWGRRRVPLAPDKSDTAASDPTTGISRGLR